MGAGVCCSRITIFILNLIMLVVSLAVIALAIWIRVDSNFEKELRRNIEDVRDPEPLSDIKYDMRTTITVVFWVIIGFGIACALLGFTGLMGSATRSRSLLAIYFVMMIVLVLLEIAVGIYVLVKRKDVRSTVKDYVFFSYQLSSQDIQTLQIRYDCCGADNLANNQCIQEQVTCSSAVWDRLDFTMMIFGISMLGVTILQLFTALVSLPVFVHTKGDIHE